MSELKATADAQAGDYRIEVDRRLIPIAILLPLALIVDIVAKAAGFGDAVRVGVAAAVGAVFVGVAVATTTNRAATTVARHRPSEQARLRETLLSLTDDELAVRALELFWAEIDLDESISPQLKLHMLENLQETVNQLRDPTTKAEGRGRLMSFCFDLGLQRGGLQAGRARMPGEARPESGGHVNAGVDLERSGDLAGAEREYRRADATGDVIGAVRLGALLARRGDVTSAQDAYRRADLRGSAAGVAPPSTLLENRGDLAGAEAAYRRADARGSPAGSAALASVLERLGKQDEAEAAYQRVADHTSHTMELIGTRGIPATRAVRGEDAGTGQQGDPASSGIHCSHVTEVTFTLGEARPDEVRSAVDEAVSELLSTGGGAAEIAKAVGVEPSALEGASFSVEQVHQGFDAVTSSIVISVTSALGAEAVTTIWNDIIYPRVMRRLADRALGGEPKER